MKNILIIVCFLFIENVQLSAQTILNGKYDLTLLSESNSDSSALYLKTNFPINSLIDLTLENSESNHSTSQSNIRQHVFEKKILILKSKKSIHEVRIQKFSIQYSEFGEEYCIQWDNENNLLSFTKQGRIYQYANPFNIKTTKFYWKDGIESDIELSPTSENIPISKN